MNIYVLILIAFLIIIVVEIMKKKSVVTQDLIDIVQKYVPFIHALDEEEKKKFYSQILVFINQHDFQSVDVEIEVSFEDKVLISSCAVMLFFFVGTKHLQKLNKIYIAEKLIDYQGTSKKASGVLKQNRSNFDLYISMKSLMYGFRNLDDNKNVGVHELAHLFDGLDGSVDGWPQFFIDEDKLNKWEELVAKYREIFKTEEVDKYALTNNAEFFAVLTEYFFENPFAMSQKYMDLYLFFTSIYKVDLVKKYHENHPKVI